MTIRNIQNFVTFSIRMFLLLHKPYYKVNCAETVIAYKMKNLHNKDFLKALIICKSALSCTFVIMFL